MSNEVYIDGYNVAECEFYYYSIQTHCNYCNRSQYSSYCNDYPDCYFKQLQRAKAEKQDLIDYFELREGGMQEDIQYWKNKAQEFYKELEEYKKIKTSKL